MEWVGWVKRAFLQPWMSQGLVHCQSLQRVDAQKAADQVLGVLRYNCLMPFVESEDAVGDLVMQRMQIIVFKRVASGQHHV